MHIYQNLINDLTEIMLVGNKRFIEMLLIQELWV